MTVPFAAGVLCLLIGFIPAVSVAGPPVRGCVMLVPSSITLVSAELLIRNDLCVPDGQVVGYLSVWQTKAWTGKVVPPYNRVTMQPRPGDGPATVSIRTASGLYRAEIEALQDCNTLPPIICYCTPPRTGSSPAPQDWERTCTR